MTELKSSSEKSEVQENLSDEVLQDTLKVEAQTTGVL